MDKETIKTRHTMLERGKTKPRMNGKQEKTQQATRKAKNKATMDKKEGKGRGMRKKKRWQRKCWKRKSVKSIE